MEWAKCRRRDLLILICCTTVFFFWFHIQRLPSTLHQSLPSLEAEFPREVPQESVNSSPIKGTANATLGFGKIIAVSTRASSRRTGLALSANLTGLEINIPEQPRWTDADVESIRDKKHSRVLKASALAWLGHLNALKWFLASGQDTALIIEDDVDWDIRIRHQQIPLVSLALSHVIREYKKSQMNTRKYSPQYERSEHSHLARRSTSAAAPAPAPEGYWPPAKDWEIIYMGHCGDYFKPENLTSLPHVVYPDSSVPPFPKLHSDTQKFLFPLGVPQRHRMLHKSARPLCTFAYAVTRASATRIVKELSHEERSHGTWAYDVRILEACRDLGFKCWSVNPELFHHVDEFASEIARVNGKPLFKQGHASRTEGGGAADRGSDEDDDYEEEEEVKGLPPRPHHDVATVNIQCATRRLAEKVGHDVKAWEAVKKLAAVDGLCVASSQD